MCRTPFGSFFVSNNDAARMNKHSHALRARTRVVGFPPSMKTVRLRAGKVVSSALLRIRSPGDNEIQQSSRVVVLARRLNGGLHLACSPSPIDETVKNHTVISTGGAAPGLDSLHPQGERIHPKSSAHSDHVLYRTDRYGAGRGEASALLWNLVPDHQTEQQRSSQKGWQPPYRCVNSGDR